jgi:hypothetical protein
MFLLIFMVGVSMSFSMEKGSNEMCTCLILSSPENLLSVASLLKSAITAFWRASDLHTTARSLVSIPKRDVRQLKITFFCCPFLNLSWFGGSDRDQVRLKRASVHIYLLNERALDINILELFGSNVLSLR